MTLCKLFESLVFVDGIDFKQEVGRLHGLLATVFAFCYLWSVGGNVAEQNWDVFDTFARHQFEDAGEAKVRTDITDVKIEMQSLDCTFCQSFALFYACYSDFNSPEKPNNYLQFII